MLTAQISWTRYVNKPISEDTSMKNGKIWQNMVKFQYWIKNLHRGANYFFYWTRQTKTN